MKKMYRPTLIHEFFNIHIAGDVSTVPCTAMANGCVGVMMLFDTAEHAAEFAESRGGAGIEEVLVEDKEDTADA